MRFDVVLWASGAAFCTSGGARQFIYSTSARVLVATCSTRTPTRT